MLACKIVADALLLGSGGRKSKAGRAGHRSYLGAGSAVCLGDGRGVSTSLTDEEWICMMCTLSFIIILTSFSDYLTTP